MTPHQSADTPEDVRARTVAKLAALKADGAAREATDPAPAAAPCDTTRAMARDDEDRPRRSQATRLVDLALNAGAELWHTATGDPHITITIAGHQEHHTLGSRAIADYLARLHHQQTQQTPGSQAIADALHTLGGLARYDGAEHTVHVRVAGHDGAVFLDLGDATRRAYEITAAGWRSVTDPPVRFRRGRALLALPEAVRGGSLDALQDVIHVATDDDWRLLVAWLVGALRASGPYPVLGFDGEQGSGKSTDARMLRRLIDPSGAELRAEPREIRDLMIAAAGGWLVALDNVSHLQPWLSDALCRISTGGALSTRQLYTDGDEHIVEAVRPIIITGITSVIARGDLQDRTIALTLPAIPDHRRRPEADLWAAYDHIRPAVLGALLDAVACALRREHEIRLASLPRMADWARWVTASEPALGIEDGGILRAYTGSRQHATEQALDGDPLAVALRALTRPWEGTAADLLTRLTPAGRSPRGWPESPRGLSGALRRLAPQLRRIDIEIRTYREAGTGRRVIKVEDAVAEPSRPSRPSPGPDSLAHYRDGRGDGGDATEDRLSQHQACHRDGCDCGDGCDGVAPNSTDDRLEASWRTRP